MRFEFTFGTSRPASRRRNDGTPTRLLILSDLRGPAADPAERLLDRPLARVDVDNVEDVLARHAPSVVLGAQAGGERLLFRSYQDFHPDSLVRHTTLFGRFLDLRRRLEDPRTFAGTAAELLADAAAKGRAPLGPPSSPPAADADRGTLERLLGQKPAAPPVAQQPSAAVSTVDALIRRIIAPHVVPAIDPQVPQLLSAIDTAIGDVMRRVLHDPGFQQVEATWRGIQWLVNSLELGEELELRLLHVTRGELSQGAGPDSELYRRLVDREGRTGGGLELSLLVVNYRFGATHEDLAALESLGSLAQALNVPLVAESAASLLGTPAIAEQPDPRDWAPLGPEIEATWNALRASPSARSIGLALPRFLLRLPYGAKSDPIETFRFEEQPPTPEHESFLWGCPALACAAVLARVLQAEDVSADMGDIAGLPTFLVEVDDEPRLQPGAEVCLSERAIDAILARGVMPVVGFKDRDVARLVRLQSIADPPTALLR